jgi:hypothetical protein
VALETRQRYRKISMKPDDKPKKENHVTVTCANMILIYGSLVWLFFTSGCSSQKTHFDKSMSLCEARRGFKTILLPKRDVREAVEQAPASIFKTIKYSAPSGEFPAYISPDPGDGKKHPAIIWITGGDCNSIGDVWSPTSRSNDQTASAFRKAGLVMMFPSLRGGNNNPGSKEGFLGEVDDVLAAAKYLETQQFVDPKQIFLGGHSTGGTLALLVAESSDRFRAVFSFGPVGDVSDYGRDSKFLPFDLSNPKEIELRSPGYWLSWIQSPVWVFEGTRGNIESLREMAKASTNPKAHFIEVQNMDHFSVLAPMTDLIAKKILQDTGDLSNLSFSADEVNRNIVR